MGLLCLTAAPVVTAATTGVVQKKAAPVKANRKTAKKATTPTKATKPKLKKSAKKTAGQGNLATPEPAQTPAQSQEQAQALEQERAALKEKLAQLKRDIAAGESTRSEVADQLATSERAISDVNRKLRDLGMQQSRAQNQLADIGQNRTATQAKITAQQTQLSGLLREQYVTGTQDPFKLLFSGDDPNRIQRDLVYLGYVSQAQAGVLHGLRDNLDHLQKLGDEAATRNAELASIAQEQQSSRSALVQEQENRRITLASIASKLEAQRREAGALERDEQRLGRVVEQIARVLAQQAQEAREREKKRQELLAQKAREQERLDRERELKAQKPDASGQPAAEQPEASTRTAPEAVNNLVPQAGFVGNFAALKGQLRLPVKGELTARYGKTRSEGGPSWKGVFIRAAEGLDVKAIAAGRVVFAEWLRGFGNLIIVDHGSQYLSIYGNNQALLKQPGDIVQGGDVLASVGNSGGNPETGLYFELRFQGRPFDPLSWAKLR